MTEKSNARQVLLDLADRCEREEPSRELDFLIGVALVGRPPIAGWEHELPCYTTSVDAAFTLSNWLLISLSDIAADGMIQCELGDPGRNLVAVSVCARTRALALCASSLRARAQEVG